MSNGADGSRFNIIDTSSAFFQDTSFVTQKDGYSTNYNYNKAYGCIFDASKSNSIYGNYDTVQPPAYLVNMWKRTA